MGWRIETNNVNKWEITSSETENTFISFDSEHKLKMWLATDFVYEGKKKAIETLLTFPNKWTINDQRNFARGGSKNYYDWLESLDEFKTYEEYYKAIDDKLDKLTRDLKY